MFGAPQAALQFDELAELGDTLGGFQGFAFGITTIRKHFKQGTCSGIALWMNEGVVQGFNTIGDFEEACRLHKGGRAQTGDLLQVCTRFERAVFFAILDDGISDTGVDT